MKTICLSILLGFSTTPLFTQVALIQSGLVREQNSGKRPISDVQIIFSDAVPTTSEQSGKFQLSFKDKKAGDLIFMTEITKKGYELVNKKELEVIKIGSSNNLNVDIILAKEGTVNAAKKEYYGVSDKALLAGFNAQKQKIQNQIKNAELTQQDYLDKLEDLQKQYERQKMSLDVLSEKFARVNFDDVSEVYKEALLLFKEGKIDEAIQKLEGADFMTRSTKHIEERKRLETAKDSLSNQKTDNNKGIQEDIQALLKQAQIYVLKGQYNEAVPYYDQLLLLDINNLTILQTCADFYKQTQLIDKALPLYPKIIAHPEVEEKQKIKATQDMNLFSPRKN
jgi:tetratricopeptide (TPR) repeat protein